MLTFLFTIQWLRFEFRKPNSSLTTWPWLLLIQWIQVCQDKGSPYFSHCLSGVEPVGGLSSQDISRNGSLLLENMLFEERSFWQVLIDRYVLHEFIPRIPITSEKREWFHCYVRFPYGFSNQATETAAVTGNQWKEWRPVITFASHEQCS